MLLLMRTPAWYKKKAFVIFFVSVMNYILTAAALHSQLPQTSTINNSFCIIITFTSTFQNIFERPDFTSGVPSYNTISKQNYEITINPYNLYNPFITIFNTSNK